MSANEYQVGGEHYKSLAIQPWDYILGNGLGWAEGSVVKYVTRWRSKGGVKDLKKAIHLLEKLVEMSAASGREKEKQQDDEQRTSGGDPGEVGEDNAGAVAAACGG